MAIQHAGKIWEHTDELVDGMGYIYSIFRQTQASGDA